MKDKRMMKHKIFLTITFMLLATIVWAEEKPVQHQIKTQADFDSFVKAVNGGKDYANDVVLLLTDVKVTEEIGIAFRGTILSSMEYRPFSGTFDGCGHTMTVDIKSATGVEGPFAYIKNATIANLKVKGKVEGDLSPGGLIGTVLSGNSTVINCRVSTEISCLVTSAVVSGSGVGITANAGGIIGKTERGTVVVKGCRFDGKLTAVGNILEMFIGTAGAIIGNSADGNGITIEDCVEMGEIKGFRNVDFVCGTFLTGLPKLSRLYHNHDSEQTKWTQGKRLRRVTTVDGDFIALDFGKPANSYTVSDIKTYEPGGVVVDGKLYSAKGETLKFDFKPTLKDYVYGRPNEHDNVMEMMSNGYTFEVKEDRDLVFGALVYSLDKKFNGAGTSDYPYEIATNLDWNLLCQKVDDGNSFEGKYFKLQGDVITTHMLGYDEKHPFSGVFDGNGDERRITFNHSISQDWIGLFRYIKNASLRNIRVEGKITTSAKYAGGLVAHSSGKNSQILNCVVKTQIVSSRESDGAYGGVVAATVDDKESRLVIDACMFNGSFSGVKTSWGGFVGWQNSAVDLRRCIFKPEPNAEYSTYKNSANFIRNHDAEDILGKQNFRYTVLGDNGQGNDANLINTAYLVHQLGETFWEQDYDTLGLPKPVMSHREQLAGVKTMDGKEDYVGMKVAIQLHFGEALHNDGKFNTICLPFNMHITNSIFADGCELYQFDDVKTEKDAVKLVFRQTHHFMAGQPYLVKWTDPHSYFERDAAWFTGVTIQTVTPYKVEHGGYAFCGTFAPISHKTAYEKKYYVMGDKDTWHPVKENTSEEDILGGFRGYLTMPANTTRAIMSFEDENGETTDIQEVRFDGIETNTGTPDGWYDLKGRKLPGEPTSPGIYIYKGKKIIK